MAEIKSSKKNYWLNENTSLELYENYTVKKVFKSLGTK